jgi:hypothetical protein
MVLWELVKTIQRSSRDRERTLMLHQTVNDAVLDGSLWRGRKGQSAGISPTPFPENLAITKLNIAVHMMSCGVTTQFWDEHLRPFVSRGIGHQPSTMVNHDSPEPGQILTPTTSARNLARQQSGDGGSSMASTPPAPSEARPISRARSQSALWKYTQAVRADSGRKGIARLAKSAQVQTCTELGTKWEGLYTRKGARMYICGTGRDLEITKWIGLTASSDGLRYSNMHHQTRSAYRMVM